MAQTLANLAVGAKVRFGKHSIEGETAQPISWIVVSKNYSKYPANTVTLFTEKIIDQRCFDAAEDVRASDGSDPCFEAGFGSYKHSNLNQWLNKDSAAGSWYVAQHSCDTPPDSARVFANTPYTSRPGFLYHFSEDEKSAIIDTPINDYSTNEIDGKMSQILCKVFLPVKYEIGNKGGGDLSESGTAWEYITGKTARAGYLSDQCRTYSKSQYKPGVNQTKAYWLRPHQPDGGGSQIGVYEADDLVTMLDCNRGDIGVRPVVNLSSTQKVSDTVDADGYYTLIYNAAPTAPATLDVPSTVRSGRVNTISWGASTDTDGDSITYVLECAYDGGSFSQIYSGTARSYAHTVLSKTSIIYRVKAIDAPGKSSAYTTSASRTIVNNKTPTISGTDGSLGTKTAGFTFTYTVNDVDADTVTVVEKIDGTQLRSYTATLGATNTFSMMGETWLKLSNGTHNVTITATDVWGGSVTRTHTFTKSVNTLVVQNSSPMESSSMPTRIVVAVTRNIPTVATFKVEVCNNGFDTSPAWEDATDSVTGNFVHQFENKSKTAAKWGVLIRVTVGRNGGSGECYVSAIGGNFE